MKYFFTAILFLLITNLYAQPYETFHDFTELSIIHDSLPLSDLAGKKVLVVNTASYCGFTPQLSDLVILDSLYGGPNFAIICFPCNDFGGQEPYDDSTIYQFYLGNYHVGYLLMSKISITAPDTAEVYKWLQLQSRNGVANANVTWNFNKFCIDEAGHWVHYFPSAVSPLDTAITNWIQSPNTTGILPKDKSSELSLEGNPAQSTIRLTIHPRTAEDLRIDLYDLQGKHITQLFEGRLTEKYKLSYTPHNLEQGIYFLKVQGTYTRKTLKLGFIH